MRFKLCSVTVAIVSGLAMVMTSHAEADEAAEERRPNFVFIFTDDQGYGDLGLYGAEDLETPHIDQMAAEGITLWDFYAQPVCGVSRASLLTGSQPMRIAEPGNRKRGHPILHPDEVTFSGLLRESGYRTALIGKWHLSGGYNADGYNPEHMPNHHGFEYFYGTPLHNGFTPRVNHDSFKTQLMENDRMLHDALTQEQMDELTRDYTERAVDFIREHQDEPFFLYLSHNMPHIPLGVSEAFRGTSDRGLYGDVIQELDWSAGQVLETLKELGLDEHTFVIFTSDNGPWIEPSSFPIEYSGVADPLRGAKMQSWEGGSRVPFVARWPGVIPEGRQSDELVAIMDLMPTFLNAAGVEIPEGHAIDGFDVMPLFSGQTDKSPRDVYEYYAFVHLQAVREGDWKLVVPRPERPPWTGWSARMIEEVEDYELYNLSEDIAEEENVAADHLEVVEQLKELAERTRRELGDYDTVGEGARFFDDAPLRRESSRWIDN